jgi:CTP:molybdopterin cytidylyltransferase MocA
MGGPKALLASADGVPMAVAHARLRIRECASVVVVVRSSVARQLRPWLPEGARVVASSAPGGWGPAGSIAAAVRAGVLDRRWVLVTPVDIVPAKSSTVQSLLQVCMEAGGRVNAVRPRVGGRGGHPVALRTDALVRAYLEDSPLPLRDVMHGWGCVDVDVDDSSIRADLNTPEAYRAWAGGEPRFGFVP